MSNILNSVWTSVPTCCNSVLKSRRCKNLQFRQKMKTKTKCCQEKHWTALEAKCFFFALLQSCRFNLHEPAKKITAHATSLPLPHRFGPIDGLTAFGVYSESPASWDTFTVTSTWRVVESILLLARWAQSFLRWFLHQEGRNLKLHVLIKATEFTVLSLPNRSLPS